MPPLLTIAIPTYNRAQLLTQCLNALLSQCDDDIRDNVEFLISDNCSSDNTAEVVNGFLAGDISIAYHRNSENLGADRNIANCFIKAAGKYVWVFSDDDFLLQGYLKFIVQALYQEEWGTIYLNNFWYTDNYPAQTLLPNCVNLRKINNPLDYISEVSYWTTFITGNIINRSLFIDVEYIKEFYQSNLVQLSWTLPAVFKGKPNGIITDQVLACRADNTGGYKLLKVFGKNFNNVMMQLIAAGLIDKRAKRIINRNLLSNFFPMFLNKPTDKFESENTFKVMIPVFWSYRSFWVKIFPVLFRNRYFRNVSVQ
ncbi:glycosyltransferase family 2 protein [Mucilaginibacter terrenus]|uniref:glycosyltransferase family 2 protein n=1 Tax=Mucilaginibacter terrenus TaxID=2482727 RepID=UPI001403950F|nr:glycosyltransferase family 2 protein [Mucilaginibacter terrenus]